MFVLNVYASIDNAKLPSTREKSIWFYLSACFRFFILFESHTIIKTGNPNNVAMNCELICYSYCFYCW